MVDIAELRALAEMEGPHLVSLYLPTHQAGPETRQDPIRLNNLLNTAAQELEEAGCRRPEAEALLEPARQLLDDQDFWRHQALGLAVLVGPDFFRCERLPIEVAEQVVVAPRFHLKPLLPLAARGDNFFILSLTAAEARLYRAARFGCTEVDADFPHGVGEITAETEYDNEQHASPPARPRTDSPIGMPASHNFGEDPEEQRKAQLVEYVRRVLGVLDRETRDTDLPIVLVAQPEMQGHARALAKSLDFAEGGVELDPAALRPDELHQRAWELAGPLVMEHRERALERFLGLFSSGDDKALGRPAEILHAAREGRVDSLFVAEGEALWGRADERVGNLGAHGSRTPGDEDVLDAAAMATLLRGGRVELVPKDRLPSTAPLLGAILRY